MIQLDPLTGEIKEKVIPDFYDPTLSETVDHEKILIFPHLSSENISAIDINNDYESEGFRISRYNITTQLPDQESDFVLFYKNLDSTLLDLKEESVSALYVAAGYALATGKIDPEEVAKYGYGEYGLEEEVRERTDALDSLGNTTAATGKGFAIGSAALTALALMVSYIDKVKEVAAAAGKEIVAVFDLTNPTVLVGLFIGACLPFVFAALTMESVGKAAQSVVVEVRRQFKQIAGLMEGKAEPDYASCVDLCTKASLRQMILPTVVAVVAPIIVGMVLGFTGVVGMLAGATVSGFLLAIFMSNSGGAWDNAKKYIESGVHGGKGSDQHKAAVVGDTVGDPFKDTSGPAINILIKLLSMVSIVFATLVVNYHIL